MSKYLFITILFVNCLTFAQDGTWTKAEGSCLAVNVSPEQAKSIALENARFEAIKNVVGLKLSEEVFRSVEENISGNNANEFNDIFKKFTRTSTYGKIVEEKYTFETSMENNYPLYIAKIDARVVEEKGNIDPNFKAEIILNKTKYIDRGNLKINDKLDYSIHVSENAYLYLFNIMSNDSVQLVLPNQAIENTYYSTELKQQKFESKILSLGMSFTVGLPANRNSAIEGLMIIALKDKHDFKSSVFSTDGNNVIPTYKSALSEIMEWLVAIPLDRRTEAFASYEIVKGR
ncbi:MAG: DUF4384 domain-containing protein [bacterium]